MKTPPQLDCSWPLSERPRHFELGSVLSSVVTDLIPPLQVGELGVAHAGCWECDLSDNSLTWSGGVYDIFGLPRSAKITRDEAAALYCDESRITMERLRSYAIRHLQGFTLDAEIRPVVGGRRWMRLVAAPIVQGGQALRIHGLKMII
jgi:hypothetical protein